MPDAIALTLYSRAGCHLCDDMKRLVERVRRDAALEVTLQEVDIGGDADLERRYGHEVPVLLVNGRKVAKYRIAEEALRRLLAER
jgi:glutaredoxin